MSKIDKDLNAVRYKNAKRELLKGCRLKTTSNQMTFILRYLSLLDSLPVPNNTKIKYLVRLSEAKPLTLSINFLEGAFSELTPLTIALELVNSPDYE